MTEAAGASASQAGNGAVGKLSLYAFLTRLIWLCLAPLVLLASYLAVEDVLKTQDEHDRDANSLLLNFSASVDQDLQARINGLQMLADPPSDSEPAGRVALYREALAFLRSFGSHVVLADKDMHMLFNTRVPLGTALPALPVPKGKAAAPIALQTGRPVVGDSFLGPVAAKRLVAIAVPVLRDGPTQYLVLTTFEASQFERHLNALNLPKDWALALLDSTGEVIARRGPATRPAGTPFGGSPDVKRFQVQSQVASWSVQLDIPSAVYRAPMLAASAKAAIAVLSATLAGVIGGMLASRRLGRSLASLAQPVKPGAPPPGIQEIATVRRLLDEAAQTRLVDESRLLESAALYQHTLDSMFEGCQIIGFDWRYRYLNAAAVQQNNQAEQALIGRTMMEVYPGLEQTPIFAVLQHCMRERIAQHTQTEFRFPDGRQRWFDVNVLPAPDGIAIYSVDITEHRQAEKALRDNQHAALQEQRRAQLAALNLMEDAMAARARAEAANTSLRELSLAVEQSPESIVISNIDGKIEYVNQAFANNSGFRRDEVIGMEFRLLRSAKTSEKSMQELQHALQAGQTWKGEIVNLRKDGSEYVQFAIVSPLRQEDGRITHYVAVKEDITEKKRVSLELEQHRHHLEELVASRTTELEAARALADTANRAKSAFLANMSHEIRTPMNAIIGLTWLLRQDKPSAAQSARLDKIDAAAQHLLSIINDILDLSKIEAGRLELEQTDFSLGTVLDNVHSLIAEQAHAKGLRIAVEGDTLPLRLRGDPTRLRQALLNFAGNAVKFTERGCIVLRARVEHESSAGLMIRFEVQDTGIGIAPDKLPTLFESFTQLDATTTRRFGGTGLGLAITRRLAELMGGQAGGNSVLGQGSTFWFTAVLQRGHADTAPRPKPAWEDAAHALRQDFSGARILLVEDNPINREVAMEVLRMAGLLVDTAVNGQDAVDKVRTQAFDLVLMDVQMPVMDGIAATQAIRATPAYQHLPILAMTANAFDDDRRACMAAGMDDFVAKPVVPSDLYRTLLRWLSDATDRVVHANESNRDPARPGADVRSGLPPPMPPLPGVDDAYGLQLMRGDVAKYQQLLRLFASTHANDMQRAMECLSQDQGSDLRHIAHGLKSAAATIGARTIADLATELDLLLRTGSALAECAPIVLRCETEMRVLVAAIHGLPAPAPSAEAVGEPASAQLPLEQLCALLAGGHIGAVQMARDQQAALRAGLGTRYATFESLIDRFDFEAALEVLQSLDAA